MSRMKNLSVFAAILAAAAVTQVASFQNASAGIGGTKILDQTGCSVCCPECNHVCKLDAKKVDDEKTCFDVESKVICYPTCRVPLGKRGKLFPLAQQEEQLRQLRRWWMR